jgi:hypothetical protein
MSVIRNMDGRRALAVLVSAIVERTPLDAAGNPIPPPGIDPTPVNIAGARIKRDIVMNMVPVIEATMRAHVAALALMSKEEQAAMLAKANHQEPTNLADITASAEAGAIMQTANMVTMLVGVVFGLSHDEFCETCIGGTASLLAMEFIRGFELGLNSQTNHGFN